MRAASNESCDWAAFIVFSPERWMQGVARPSHSRYVAQSPFRDPCATSLSREVPVSFDLPSVNIARVGNPTDGTSMISIQVSPLRRRMIDDITIRNMTPGTRTAVLCGHVVRYEEVA